MLGSLIAQGLEMPEVFSMMRSFAGEIYETEISDQDLNDWVLEWRAQIVLFAIKASGIAHPIEVVREAPVTFLHLRTRVPKEAFQDLLDFLGEHLSDTMIFVTKPEDDVSWGNLSDEQLENAGLMRIPQRVEGISDGPFEET